MPSASGDNDGDGLGLEELLDQHRRDIEALDRRILHLVCERLELARQIGELKRRCGVPLRNFEVEAQVHRRFECACRDLHLEPVLGRDLAVFLIDKAVEEQATLLDARYAGERLRSLVVGGKGGMGRWMAGFLAGQGHEVTVLDPAPEPSLFREASDLAAARDAELVVLAVPMTVCAGLLEELAEVGPRGVVAEMCSLKGHLEPVTARVRGGGMRLVSFHPMFGPDVRMLSGRTIVICREGDPADRAVVQALFADTSVRLVELDIPDHDRRMSLVLGLTHLANLVFARALSRSGVGAEDLAQVAGVTFSKQLATTREVAGENPELYFQIQALNRLTAQTGRRLAAAAEELVAAVEAGDGEGFAEIMGEVDRFLSGAVDGGPQ